MTLSCLILLASPSFARPSSEEAATAIRSVYEQGGICLTRVRSDDPSIAPGRAFTVETLAELTPSLRDQPRATRYATSQRVYLTEAETL
jgi:hypothetical protein